MPDPTRCVKKAQGVRWDFDPYPHASQFAWHPQQFAYHSYDIIIPRFPVDKNIFVLPYFDINIACADIDTDGSMPHYVDWFVWPSDD